jgi:hypothetical protein
VVWTRPPSQSSGDDIPVSSRSSPDILHSRRELIEGETVTQCPVP